MSTRCQCQNRNYVDAKYDPGCWDENAGDIQSLLGPSGEEGDEATGEADAENVVHVGGGALHREDNLLG